MKPKFLLCPGTGYSATTPLYYTLAVNHNYCHGGFDKEYELLPTLFYKETNRLKEYIYHYKYRFRRHFINQPFDNGVYKKHGFKRERHPKVDFNNSYTNLNAEYYYNRPITLEKYIQYYKEHYNNIKNTYHSVCDFTTANGNIPLWFLSKISSELQEHFDVKVLIINRDPVRRLFSEVNVRFQKDNYEFSSAKQMFFYVLNNPTGRHFGLHRQYENFNVLSYHKDVVSNYSSSFSNVLQISMESLWDGTEQISDFLNYKIEHLYNNAYYPFMGSNPPHYKYLADQWMSDIEELSDDEYKQAKEYF